MRVIAGTARGTRLKSPRGRSVRPTADAVREALFNIIGERVWESHFIDFFSGSGAVGIEALSRGANFCTFVEIDRANIALIRANLEKTRLLPKARLLNASAEKGVMILNKEACRADIVFLDPPYNSEPPLKLLDLLRAGPLLTPGGLIIVEHRSTWPTSLDLPGATKTRKYGKKALTFLSPPGPA